MTFSHLLTLADVKQPPFDASFLRWHTFERGETTCFVDRKETVHVGRKLAPTIYKQVRHLPTSRHSSRRP